MNLRPKISWRKVLQSFITIVVVTGSIVAILSASKLQDKRTLKGIDIGIKNDKYGFIDKDQVKAMLFTDHINIAKSDISKLNAHSIEQAIDSNPWVADAQVYVDNARVLHINLTQRVPVVRLFDQSGNSYYLDNSLKAMPLSDKYIHYATVVTNMPVFNNDSADKAFKGEVVALVKHIEKDSFWRAQISQVMVTNDRTFELIPVLGNQRIILGDTSEMQAKFDNLFAFYKKVLNRIGWDKYETLDLRFTGQVVASPALPWKMPIDKALTSMNWVKSIIGKDTLSAMPDTSLVPQGIPGVEAMKALENNDGINNNKENKAVSQIQQKKK